MSKQEDKSKTITGGYGGKLSERSRRKQKGRQPKARDASLTGEMCSGFRVPRMTPGMKRRLNDGYDSFSESVNSFSNLNFLVQVMQPEMTLSEGNELAGLAEEKVTETTSGSPHSARDNNNPQLQEKSSSPPPPPPPQHKRIGSRFAGPQKPPKSHFAETKAVIKADKQHRRTGSKHTAFQDEDWQMAGNETEEIEDSEEEDEEEDVLPETKKTKGTTTTRPPGVPLLRRSLRLNPSLDVQTTNEIFMKNLSDCIQSQMDGGGATDDEEEEVDDDEANEQDIEGGGEVGNNESTDDDEPGILRNKSEVLEEAKLTEQTSLLGSGRKPPWQGRRKHPNLKRRRTQRVWYHCLCGWWSRIMRVLRPREVCQSIKNFILRIVLLLMVPLLALAWALFYVLENPVLQFLPRTAALSWYIIFAVRWLVTLTLARISQWFLLLATRTHLMARVAGPFVTLMALQSIGWPFLCMSWGFWNLLILHGQGKFCKNWLFFVTGAAMFDPTENPDDGVLDSDLYGRILGVMIIVGFVSGIKRTLIALYLSRRMLLYYKPQLKEMMYQIKLVTGVAGLAAETLKRGFGTVLNDAVAKATEVQIMREPVFMDAVPSFGNTAPVPPSEASPSQGQFAMDGVSNVVAVSASKTSQGNIESDDDSEDYDDKTEQSNSEDHWERWKKVSDPWQNESSGSAIGTVGNVMASIPNWEPPVDKSQKEEPTLNDMLEFRKAVAFMEGNYPFSRAYGLCDSREACIKSALRVYKRLLKFIPQDKEPTLLFDVIGVLAYHNNGEWDEKRAVELMRVYTPDKDYRLSRNAFVRSCDNVYKRMVFLLASMNNASKIDSVLEEIFDHFFYGILAIVMLSLLGLNIWPLLASFSTILLSFTFAFSSSTARAVEGIMLIAVRRPFDIGDRITISNAQGACPGPADAWFVEDIDLTTTTLRRGLTNEVATINNSSLTNCRIVNYARSSKACITVIVHFQIETQPTQIERFRRRVKKYLKNRPSVWEALLCFRNCDLSKTEGFISYILIARHTKPWQDPSVLMNKAKLENQVDKISSELGIGYVRQPDRMEVAMIDEIERKPKQL
ncbi:expressed unknown protein [Seminavis robusta]|uniref:Mechanosensitive ion channel MscS domain-containing protein n=1 Tax=Seminavis robusta TaxID=568900 RepID=A0A9N8DV54_9STRA|nr:expressed unknown protein [Seminavis robusta]|eukprot:Sro384_g131400.1 n/a (1075) ;mRNA; f:10750-14154